MNKHHNTLQTLEVLSIFGIFIFYFYFYFLHFFLAKIILIVGDDEYKVNSAANIVVGFDALNGRLLYFKFNYFKLNACSSWTMMSTYECGSASGRGFDAQVTCAGQPRRQGGPCTWAVHVTGPDRG